MMTKGTYGNNAYVTSNAYTATIRSPMAVEVFNKILYIADYDASSTTAKILTVQLNTGRISKLTEGITASYFQLASMAVDPTGSYYKSISILSQAHSSNSFAITIIGSMLAVSSIVSYYPTFFASIVYISPISRYGTRLDLSHTYGSNGCQNSGVVAWDRSGNLFIAPWKTNPVPFYRIDPTDTKDPAFISNLATTSGTYVYSIAFDISDNLYFCTSDSVIYFALKADGYLNKKTVAGTFGLYPLSLAQFLRDGNSGTSTSLLAPQVLRVNRDNVVYFLDGGWQSKAFGSSPPVIRGNT